MTFGFELLALAAAFANLPRYRLLVDEMGSKTMVMYRLLVSRHLSSRSSKPAVRWMTRFAFVAFAVAMFSWVTVHSVMRGLQGERVQILVDEQPHLLWESTPIRLDDVTREKLLGALKAIEVKSINFLLQTEGLMEVANSKESGRVQGAGVLMRADEALSPGEVLVGGELSRMTRVGLGSELKLRSVWNLEGFPIKVRVAGLVHPRDFDAAKEVLRISPQDLETLIEQKGAVSRIEVSLVNPEQADRARELVRAVMPDHWQTWRDLNRSLLVSLTLERNMMSLAMFFLVVLASLALYLSLSVRVVERTRQSALLLALGAKSRRVRNVFLLEGLSIGVVGTLLGVSLASLVCWYLKHYFLLPEVYYSRSVPVDLSWSSAIALSGFAMLLALVASYFPAAQVAKIEIAEALK